ncbi:MAG: hypothetical protein RL721_1057 [Candidatus Eisenbacteria bacterium]|jgi:DNA polymerase III delta subunit
MATRKTSARGGRGGDSIPAPVPALELLKRLEGGDFPGTIHLEGSDEAIKAAFLADLRAAWARAVPEAPPARIMRPGDEDGVDAILAAYQNTSMFDPRQLVIVFRLEELVRSEKRVQALAEGLGRPGGESCLVLVESAPSDKPRKMLDAVRAAVEVRVEVGPADPRTLIEWGRRRLAAHGVKAEAGVLQSLVERCEQDPLAFLNETSKLAVLAGEGGTASEEHVRSLASPTLDAELPAFLMAVAQGDAARAAQRLERVLVGGESEGSVMWALGHLATSALASTSQRFAWSRWKEATAAMVRGRDARSLARAIDAVYRAEAAWKGGRCDARTALEQVTRELAAR